MSQPYRIAVIIPCFNEAPTIGSVVTTFQHALPTATIYVYDNNSHDDTAALAHAAGATVRRETMQGKGHVVRRAFADIEADIYLLVDGDGQHAAPDAIPLIQHLLTHQLDMVIGARDVTDKSAYRPKHASGNRLFNHVVARLFRHGISDIFSGYRVFSRRFVKSFPAASTGFEIETELSIHALDAHIPFDELAITHHPRPEGSYSKLNTWRDGLRISWMIVNLYRQIKPLQLFGAVALLLFTTALLLGWPLVTVFLETRMVPRIPTAIIVMGILVFSFLSLTCGIILEGIAQARRENRRLHYLQQPALR